MTPNQELPEEKKARIIRAAMENFAKNGYRKATVDEIVADAGISKGLIFHYFGSKKNLYIYLYEYAYGLVYSHVVQEFNAASPDLFERIRRMEEIKLEIMKGQPCVFDFLSSVHREKDGRLLEELEKQKVSSFPDWTPGFLAGVDASKLREGISLEKAVNMIRWCTEGVLAEHKDNFVQEEIFSEMDSYLDMLRTAFYREEFL